jgi:hypothetical protein
VECCKARQLPIAGLSRQVERNRAGCAMVAHLKRMSERADVSFKGRCGALGVAARNFQNERLTGQRFLPRFLQADA